MRLFKIWLARRALLRAERRALNNRWNDDASRIDDYNRVIRAQERLRRIKYP